MISVLHIGGNVTLDDKEVIGIFSGAGINPGFFEACAQRLALRNVAEGSRSFVLAGKKGKNFAYFSKITARNLIKRMNRFKEDFNG
jgi:hypothetical protein